MQAIKFETITQQHRIQIPAEIPDGVSVRVVLLWEPVAEDDDTLKRLIAGVTEGLTEDDLTRPWDLGRGVPEWGP
ncbi:MAG: hypothetical protein IPN92_13865 [Chromatiaceae bacterium]|nr:hypothetical protein [Chromatiaceae bacterium]